MSRPYADCTKKASAPRLAPPRAGWPPPLGPLSCPHSGAPRFTKSGRQSFGSRASDRCSREHSFELVSSCRFWYDFHPSSGRAPLLQRNAETCAHCGESFVRVQKTPLINRTDGESFHVSLFSGPSPRPNPAGGFFAKQVMCSFSYMHDHTGRQRKYLVVYIVDPKKIRKKYFVKLKTPQTNLRSWSRQDTD